MEEFEIITNLNTTTPTIINIPSHFSNGNWGYYVRQFRFECTTIASGNPNTSYSALSISVPYIPICIDSPVQTFDLNAKPLSIIAIGLPEASRGGTREIYSYNVTADLPIMNQLNGRNYISIYMLDVTKNLPITFNTPTGGTMTCNIGGSTNSLTVGAICVLRFILLK